MWAWLAINFLVTVLFSTVLPNELPPLNLFIGTGGEGYGVGSIPPAVQVPFGMMRLSPDTSYDDTAVEWNHFGGYYYGDNTIRCFSHTHMVGAGVTDYGNIGVMPVREIKESTIKNYGYRSKFEHQHENATAGYYSVELNTQNTLAELTVAGPYTGVHKYTFHKGNDKSQNIVIIDPSHTITKDACVNASITYNKDNNEFTGWTLMKGSLTRRNGKGIHVYFVANFSEEFVSFGTWSDGHLSIKSVSTVGNRCGAYAEFDVSVSHVLMTISLSFVSIDQARMNREFDLQNCWTKSGDGFSNCVYFSQAKWTEVLNQVNAEMMGSEELTKFYTALYHVFTVPTKFSEAGGCYKGMDDEVHQISDGSNHYSDLSLWDIHRTQTSLLTLLQPNVSLDIVKSLIRMYKDGGVLPRWPIANVYTGCMIANHANQVILDNLVKQNGVFDVSTAYQAMKEQAMNPDLPHAGRAGLKEYITDGYCPSDVVGSSVSLTLAYAYDDWAVGEVAKYLGNISEATYFHNRSKNYRNIWNEDHQLMCPRNSTRYFSCPSDPYLNSWIIEKSAYTEGNAGQWRWFVPHDILGLVELFKSKQFFISELDKFFSHSKEDPYNILPNPYYWAGNEPDLLAVYLFNYVGRADLTQKYSRWLVEEKYTTAPSGIPGNDDYGTMSAWYIWSSLGLYPLTGTDMYFIGSPVVTSATLKLHQNFVITAYNNSKSNVFVKEVRLNSKKIDLQTSPFLHHSDIIFGGKLEFWMTRKQPDI